MTTASAEVFQLPTRAADLPPRSIEELRKQLRKKLSDRGFKLFVSSLTGFQNYEVSGNKVLFFDRNKEFPLCLIGQDNVGVLLGNASPVTTDVNITALRNLGRTIPSMIKNPESEALQVFYCDVEMAMVVSAHSLLDKLR